MCALNVGIYIVNRVTSHFTIQYSYGYRQDWLRS